MKRYLLSLILILFVFLCSQCSRQNRSDEANSQKQPNILILFTDDMGYANIQNYGNPNIRTPHIDAIGKQGIRFTSYLANASCAPSRTELLTGVYFPRVHFGGGTGAGGHGGLPDSMLTLAEGLKEAGYATGMAGKWHLGYDPKKYLPTNQGFDSWLGLPYSNDYKRPYVQTDVPLALYRGTTIIQSPVNQDSLTVKYTAEAKRFIRTHTGEQPFFFYLAYNMPHLPLHTTKKFLGKSGAGLYGDVIETIDWSVGQVLKTLQQEGLADNTIVFFAADNGPWTDAPPRMYRKPTKPEGSAWKKRRKLYHKGNEPGDQGTTGPLRGAKGTTYEGGFRVSAMVRWPGHIKPGQVSNELVTNLDIFRTFLAVGGGKEPDYPLDGYDMMPLFTGNVNQSPRKTYAYMRSGLNAFRLGKWKLRLTGTGHPQLFNLNRDPGEQYNLAAKKPETVKRIRRRMKKTAKRLDVQVKPYHYPSFHGPAYGPVDSIKSGNY